jgi:pimeloyl-ACP methyl ester carboxylesterase
MTLRRPAVVLVALGLAVLSVGCRSPSERFRALAAARSFHAEVVTGTGFQHLVLSAAPRPGRMLHVYLDGDGVPWLGGYPAVDPTPRDPLVLDLLALDPGPAVYLGRPCYHGLDGGPPCVPGLWTSARYSDDVVASMAAAARRVLAARGATGVVWLGYSGGGVLAMLLAARVAETTGVITLAANLDVDAWANRPGWLPLAGSLDPARLPSLPSHIVQRHYAGGRDRQVPVEVTRGGVAAGAELVVVPDYDHRCCWQTRWPAVLADLERDARTRRE